MADTTVTVKQDGTGDYTTITAAENAANVSSGYYKIEIDDSNTYNETVSFAGSTGTNSINNYVWLTVSAGNRHDGVAGNGASIERSSGNVLSINENFVRVEHLELVHAGTNRDAVYCNAADILFSRCMFITTSTGHDAIWAGADGDIFVDNCVFSGQNRNGIKSQGVVAGLYIDYCTFGNLGANTDVSFGGIRQEPDANGAVTSLYNNIIVNCPAYAYGASNVYNGFYGTSRVTDYGSNNVKSNGYATSPSNQGSITNDIAASSISDTNSGSTIVSVNETSLSTLDFTLTNLTVNPAVGAGTNRVGSEPDSRQDFSTDIRGVKRLTTAGKIDVGAYQVTTAPGFKYWNGTDFVDTTAVQYYNGSAWVDVTGIQYWNGSAWTDPS